MAARLLSAQTHRLQFSLNSPEGGRLEIHRLYFPGWEINLDGRKLEPDRDWQITSGYQEATPDSPRVDRSGLMSIDLPAGQHLLTARFGETPVRKAGFILSGLGLFSSILFLLASGGKKLKTNGKK
jgi:hypothetical protein